MRFIVVVLAALAVLALAGCGAPNEQQAIIDATSQYITTSPDSAVKKVTVEVQKVDGDFARAYATPADGTATDPVFVFLRRENGAWQGVIFGTAFDSETYQQLGIPQSLWLSE